MTGPVQVHVLAVCAGGASLDECVCGVVAWWVDGVGWWCPRAESRLLRRYEGLVEQVGKCVRPVRGRDGRVRQCRRKRRWGLWGEWCRQHADHSWRVVADRLTTRGHLCEETTNGNL